MIRPRAMLLGLWIATVSAADYESCIIRDARGNIARSIAARAAFARANPCPSTQRPGLPCPGYRIDHIVPLKRCGADMTINMQWLTIEEWRAKTKRE